ncbi:MAG: SOS response-associated peptidase [Armatimonadetes bacterium]|nr:SOS response-associated peptidase [Armatimonadota bacterium]
MCGRFALFSSVQAIKKYYNYLNEVQDWKANYNIAPSQKIPVIINKNGEKNLEFFQWGLIPFWAKDKKNGFKMINTRAETITEKPSFKYAFQKRRCLIPANGFYEWRKKDKQPFFIQMKDSEIFSFAGIWENWKSPQGDFIQSCSIITTSANDFMKEIHHRMPAILPKDKEITWLSNQSQDKLLSLLRPFHSDGMTAHKVSKEVNSVKNNYKEFIEII